MVKHPVVVARDAAVARQQQMAQSTIQEGLHRVRVFSKDPWWSNLLNSLRPTSNATSGAASAYSTIKKAVDMVGSTAGASSFDVSYLHRRNSSLSSESDALSPQSRAYRYYDFDQMDDWPELGSALDIMADEVCQRDENEQMIGIQTASAELKREIEDLFARLSIEANAWFYVREMAKKGDKFCILKIKQGEGVIGIIDDISPQSVQRADVLIDLEEYDSTIYNIPEATQVCLSTYRWSRLPTAAAATEYDLRNRKPLDLTELDVLHFRNRKKEDQLPYGTSELNSARHHWRRLTHMEDAIFVYRIIRSPERRMFKVETGNMDPIKSKAMLTKLKDDLRSRPIINQETGEINRRASFMTMEMDYWTTMKNGKAAVEMETVPGGQFTNDIEDLNYIQSKLFAATKVPRGFLSYEENINAKATLSTQDVRFGRTIQRLQNNFLQELYRLVAIHLYFKKFDTKGDTSFTLMMTPSSLITRMQNLEMLKARIDVANDIGELLPEEWIYTNVFKFTQAEIDEVYRMRRRQIQLAEQMKGSAKKPKGGGGGGTSLDDLFAAEPPLGGGGPPDGGLGSPSSPTPSLGASEGPNDAPLDLDSLLGV